jgi:hypothetical protein
MLSFADTFKQSLASVAVALIVSVSSSAAGDSLPALRDNTVRAFASYVAKVQAGNDRNLSQGNFLWIDNPALLQDRAEPFRKLRAGEVLVRRISSEHEKADLRGGMVHDWQGIVFIRGAKIDDVLRILQDYDHHSIYYAPDVEKSKIESHSGDHYRAFLRFRRHNVITVVMNTEHDITYYRDAPTRAHSRSSAVHIAEVDNPGPNEKEKKQGDDNGFLWRMETWWHLEEKDGGVYLQNEVVTLTRDVPTGLGWAVEPFITGIPKESLEFTLTATRRAVQNHLQIAKRN